MCDVERIWDAVAGTSVGKTGRADPAPAVWLDLAYPRHRLGVEYDGGDHLRPEQVLKDIERHTRLAAAGWRVLRYTRRDIRHDPARIVREVGAALEMQAAAM